MSEPRSGNCPPRQEPDVVEDVTSGGDAIDARPRAMRGILVAVLIALAIWIVLLLVLLVLGVL